MKNVNGATAQLEPPIEAEQVAEYQPEYLPDLQAMAEWANGMQMQAARLHNSGQRIVADFRRQLDDLCAEADRMEIERQEAINQVNYAHDLRMERNGVMRANVETMIAYYTGLPIGVPVTEPAPQPQPVLQPRRQSRGPGMFRLIMGQRG